MESLLKSCDDSDADFRIMACRLLSNLCKEPATCSRSEYSKFKADKIVKTLRALLDFAHGSPQNEFKYCIIFYLNYLLADAQVGRYFAYDECLQERTFGVLESLFKSKQLSKVIKQRVAFVLLSHFVKLVDFEFIYMKNRNFFYLIIHLLCIEIGLNLQSSDYGQECSVSDQLVDSMTIYYSLLEQIIIILSTASPFDQEESDSESENENKEKNDEYEPELKRVIKVIRI